MFERIGARPNSIACARWPVRMDRDFLSERMSGVTAAFISSNVKV
jgi:hypothetical protein